MLILILLLASGVVGLAQRECSECTNFNGEKRLCANDGQMYSDLFCAQCASQGQNYALFNCESEIYSSCQSKCAAENDLLFCRRSCIPTVSFSLICGSHGLLYANICQLRCVEKSAEPVFQCRDFQLSRRRCSTKCYQLAECRILFQNLPPNPICGKDGLLYNSLEEMRCNGEYLVMYDAGGDVDYGTIDSCKEYAELRYGRVVGLPFPPVYFPSSLFQR